MADVIRYVENGEDLDEDVLNRGLKDLAENVTGELPPDNTLDATVPTGLYQINGDTLGTGNLSSLGITNGKVIVIKHDDGSVFNLVQGHGPKGGILAVRSAPDTGIFEDFYNPGAGADIGSWVPSLDNGGTIDDAQGKHGDWSLIGNTVTIWFNAKIDSIPDNSDIFTIADLPYLPDGDFQIGQAFSVGVNDIQALSSAMVTISDGLQFFLRSDDGFVTNEDMQPFNDTRLIFQMTYTIVE